MMSASTMSKFFPVMVHRTDGMLSTGSNSEPNEPQQAQKETAVDAQGIADYLRKIDPDGEKAVDWRRKLGGMLMQILVGNDRTHRGMHHTSPPLIAPITHD